MASRNDTTLCSDCGHKLHAHYAVKMAEPNGNAMPGRHVACEGCDQHGGACALQQHDDAAWAYHFPDAAERVAAQTAANGRGALEMLTLAPASPSTATTPD